jgi:hypothetical protein
MVFLYKYLGDAHTSSMLYTYLDDVDAHVKSVSQHAQTDRESKRSQSGCSRVACSVYRTHSNALDLDLVVAHSISDHMFSVQAHGP